MNIVNWEPFASLESFLNSTPTLLRRSRQLESNGGSGFEWSPSADISESDKEFLVRAELPAVKKEDVRVTLDNGMLTISGERKQREEETKEKFHRVETFYGSFSRSFSLPDAVDTAGIRAESKDGIVTIHVPKTKAEEKKRKEIKVQ